MHQTAVQREPIIVVVPPEIAPSEDLTARAREVPESVELVLCGEPQYAALFDRIARVLHRREQGNVLLVGERGVGIGALLGEMAQWAASAGIGDWGLGVGDSEAAALWPVSRPSHKYRPQVSMPDAFDHDAAGACETFGWESAGSRDPRRSYPAPPFLRGKRFVEVNCRYTVPEESRGRLLALLASVARHEELVVCIDGFASLLRSERGATNKGALLSALTSWHGGEMQSAECRVQNEPDKVFSFQCSDFSSGAPAATDHGPRTTDTHGGFAKESQSPTRAVPFLPRLIGIMTPREYEELVADDVDMLEHFARVDVPEPDVGTSIKLLRHFSKGLEQKYGIAIEPAAVELAVVLSANYILNEYLPGKALKILSRVCAVARAGGGNGRRWRAARNRGIGLARERRRTRVE